jgi:hypothetical protein
VTGSLRRDAQLARAGELDDRLDIVGGLGKRYGRWLWAGGEVPGLAGEVPVRAAGQDDAPRELAAQNSRPGPGPA